MHKHSQLTRTEQAKAALDKLDEEKAIYIQQDNEQNLIFLYEKMHRQLKILVRFDPEAYTHYEQDIEKKLIHAYIKYGTFLKSEQKDFGAAKTALEKALKLNKHLPIVQYRLGFLAYKRRAYTAALNYFKRAMQEQGEPQYCLTEPQKFYAQLYLTNSALYIAKEASEALEDLPSAAPLVNYELSPIFSKIAETEQLMVENSFYCISENGASKGSIAYCEQLCEAWDTLVLYFSDRENMCIYNGAAIGLTVNYADTLRHLLLACSVQSPGIRQQFSEFFERLDYNGEVRAEAFRQRISRLRGKLAEIGLTDVVKQTRKQGETAYYIEEIPFFVLYRVDEYTAYDYAQRL